MNIIYPLDYFRGEDIDLGGFFIVPFACSWYGLVFCVSEIKR